MIMEAGYTLDKKDCMKLVYHNMDMLLACNSSVVVIVANVVQEQVLEAVEVKKWIG